MVSTKAIIAAVVILAAAFAGVTLIGEESDAASVDVTYSLDGVTIPVKTEEDGTLVLFGPEDVKAFYTPDDPTKEFAGWKTETNAIYQFGATVVFTEPTTLTPYLKDIPQTVGFTAGDRTVTADISEGHVAVPEIDTDREGYTFDGWQWSEDGKVYSAEEVAKLTVKAGQTFTAAYSEIFEVSWVVDGVTIATGDTTAENRPADPVKEHYDFKGWAIGDSVIADPSKHVYTQDTVFTAEFEPVMLTVTFVAGEETVATVSVPYGQTVVKPSLPEGFKAWDFDFSAPITESITVKAVAEDPTEPSETFTVQFVVDGQVIATYASNAVTVPADPVKEGFAFQGWAIGDSVIADPSKHVYTQDTVLVALFKAVEVVEHTVTFIGGEEPVKVTVVDGQVVDAPEAPEGMQWDPAVDLTAPVTADMTVNAVPLKVTIQFAVDGEIVAILTQTIDYGGTVDMELLGGYTFPEGYTGWDADLTMPFYKDTTVNATMPPVVDEPDFLEDPLNVLAVVLVVVLGAALVSASVTKLFGVKDIMGKVIKRKSRDGEQ